MVHRKARKVCSAAKKVGVDGWERYVFEWLGQDARGACECAYAISETKPGVMVAWDTRREGMKDQQEHVERHRELHDGLDELVADYLNHTRKLLSETTVMELMEWSHKQTMNPDDLEM